MMKKLLIVLMVLAMAAVANAALTTVKISVDGVVDPPDVKLLPSETAVIDIHAWSDAGVSIVALLQGPATLTKGADFSAWEQSNWYVMPDSEKPDYIAAFTDMGYKDITNLYFGDIMDISEPFTQPAGKVFDELVLHCERLGDVTLTLFNPDLGVLDSQVIHQIPEPMTMVLLGLGGLFLRRRK
jgi:hypothetical protein